MGLRVHSLSFLLAVPIILAFQEKFGALSLHSPSVKNTKLQPYDACETHADCQYPCGNFDGLKPRCDNKGACVCDCSNMEIINANPIPEACTSQDFSAYDQESCVKYSGNVYNRQQARICGDEAGTYAYCTSLCKYY